MGKQDKIKNIYTFKTSYQQATGKETKQTWLCQLREKKHWTKSNTYSRHQNTSANEEHGTPEPGEKPLGGKP